MLFLCFLVFLLIGISFISLRLTSTCISWYIAVFCVSLCISLWRSEQYSTSDINIIAHLSICNVEAIKATAHWVALVLLTCVLLSRSELSALSRKTNVLYETSLK